MIYFLFFLAELNLSFLFYPVYCDSEKLLGKKERKDNRMVHRSWQAKRICGMVVLHFRLFASLISSYGIYSRKLYVNLSPNARIFKKSLSWGYLYDLCYLSPDFVSQWLFVSSEVLEDRLQRFVVMYMGQMEVVYLLELSTALFVGRLESRYHGHSTCWE